MPGSNFELSKTTAMVRAQNSCLIAMRFYKFAIERAERIAALSGALLVVACHGYI
jgi:hypothetical protein